MEALVVPHRSIAWLAHVEEGSVRFDYDLEIPYPAAWLNLKGDILVCDETHGVLRRIAGSTLAEKRGWSLPSWTEINHLAVVGSRAFIAGYMQQPQGSSEHGKSDLASPALFHRKIDAEVGEWEDCYPVEQIGRKHIGPLIAISERLIAVDNVVFPKYAIVFDDAENAPYSARIVDLPSDPNGGIIDAVLAGDRLAILSSTVHRGGSFRQIYFLDLASFRASAILSAGSKWSNTSDPLYPLLMHAKSFAMGGDLLFIACGDAGIVVVLPERVTGSVFASEFASLSEKSMPFFSRSIDNLPIDTLTLAAPVVSVEGVVGTKHDGIVLVLQLKDQSFESLYVANDTFHSATA